MVFKPKLKVKPPPLVYKKLPALSDMKVMTPATKADALRQVDVARLTPTEITTLGKADGLRYIDAGRLTPTQLKGMTPVQIKGLDAAKLTPTQLKGMDAAKFSPQQLNKLDELGTLKHSNFKKFTPDEIIALNEKIRKSTMSTIIKKVPSKTRIELKNNPNTKYMYRNIVDDIKWKDGKLQMKFKDLIFSNPKKLAGTVAAIVVIFYLIGGDALADNLEKCTLGLGRAEYKECVETTVENTFNAAQKIAEDAGKIGDELGLGAFTDVIKFIMKWLWWIVGGIIAIVMGPYLFGIIF